MHSKGTGVQVCLKCKPLDSGTRKFHPSNETFYLGKLSKKYNCDEMAEAGCHPR